MRPPERRVLVVDDDPRSRSALARIARSNGLVPVLAASAEEGLALAHGDHFGSIVTDLLMPGRGGIAMLQQLSATQPNARFVVITDPGPVDPKLLPAGCDVRVLQRPLCADQLAGLLLGTPEQDAATGSPVESGARVADRVLLIEDDEEDAVLFQESLRQAYPGQFRVTHVTTLKKARELLAQNTFDAIALDLTLPDGSGLAAVAAIQAMATDVGVVVLSGRDDDEFALQVVQAGAQDYLVKGKVGGATIGKAIHYAEERKRAQLRLAEMAFRDQLTGLANRTLFRQRVAHAIAQARRTKSPFVVLLLDLDRFKEINDGFGHDAGDAFLQEVARRLQACSRETDTVARLGGDEFAIVAQPISHRDDVHRLAERVLRELRIPMDGAGMDMIPSASIGLAAFPDSGQDSDSLLAAADAAMYVAKSNGRNTFHVHGVELTQLVAHKVQLEARLRQAIENEDFQVHYQPQCDPLGRLVGAEALLRWLTPDGELAVAASFIPVLAETGLIAELGPWILDQVCSQIVHWRDAGRDVARVAVNLSAKQVARGGLRDRVLETVAKWGLLPRDIEFEVTEATLLKETDTVARTLAELSRAGFRIALDDFGTGTCSLACLQSFPIDTLKIDSSFVAHVATDKRQRNLVGGLVQLAQRLGIDVIALGVESEAQATVLVEEGCRVMQGYFHGRPLSGDDFAALCSSRWH